MDLFTCFTTILNIGVCTEKLIVGFHEDSVYSVVLLDIQQFVLAYYDFIPVLYEVIVDNYFKLNMNSAR